MSQPVVRVWNGNRSLVALLIRQGNRPPRADHGRPRSARINPGEPPAGMPVDPVRGCAVGIRGRTSRSAAMNQCVSRAGFPTTQTRTSLRRARKTMIGFEFDGTKGFVSRVSLRFEVVAGWVGARAAQDRGRRRHARACPICSASCAAPRRPCGTRTGRGIPSPVPRIEPASGATIVRPGRGRR